MADIKISALTSSSALDGTENVAIVKSGVTVRTTTQDIADLGGAGVVVEDLAVTGTKDIDWSSGDTFKLTVTGAVVFSDINLPSAGSSNIITLYVDGDFALTLPTGWDAYKTGTYDGTVLNTITVEYVNATTPFHKVTIIQ